MKITDITRKGSEIQDGISCLFIAEKAFSYKNLPILKDSLIYYDGKRLSVNMIEFAIFQQSNIPKFIDGVLPEDEKRNYLVEKCSNCEFEVEKLESGWRGIWHDNHFDEWSGSYSDYIERIISLPSLESSEITFSSLMYKFNTLTNALVHFINLKPIKLRINNKIIELPELLEISKGDEHYTIIPLSNKMEYFNIHLQGVLHLSEDGILSGECAEDFDAEVFGNDRIKKITISKGFTIEISSEGNMEIDLFNDASHRIEKCKVRKCM
jgi:hypothetical protein